MVSSRLTAAQLQAIPVQSPRPGRFNRYLRTKAQISAPISIHKTANAAQAAGAGVSDLSRTSVSMLHSRVAKRRATSTLAQPSHLPDSALDLLIGSLAPCTVVEARSMRALHRMRPAHSYLVTPKASFVTRMWCHSSPRQDAT